MTEEKDFKPPHHNTENGERVAEDFQETQAEAIELSEKPETVAEVKFVYHMEDVIKATINSDIVQKGDELIRRKDAEEYWRDKIELTFENGVAVGKDIGRTDERQQIIEMLEKEIDRWKTILGEGDRRFIEGAVISLDKLKQKLKGEKDEPSKG